MIKRATFVLLIQCLLSGLQGQVVGELFVENQTVSGADFFFDIYLRRTSANPGSGDLYLGDADFVLTFDTACFSNPVFSKYPAVPPGNCLFTPTDASGSHVASTRNYYFSNLSTGIHGNQLLISLRGPAPANQTEFDTSVARIDQAVGTHRLGTFKLSGLVGSSCSPTLGWKFLDGPILTRVYSLAPVGGWALSPAPLVVASPPPFCTHLASPANGAVDVPATTAFTWPPAAGGPSGYLLNLGTTPGGTDLLDHFDVGSATTYDPPSLLPYGTVLYATLIPYNTTGGVAGCSEVVFTTGYCIPNLTVAGTPVQSGTYLSEGVLTSGNATVATGTTVQFTSDTGVLLGQQFTVEAGGEFTINIQVCPTQ